MAQRQLRPYHHAWLSVHPDRDEVWLKEKLCEGFDIHHVDGDHDNNEPSNLMLVEHVDHLRLHGMPLKNGIAGWRRKLAEKPLSGIEDEPTHGSGRSRRKNSMS